MTNVAILGFGVVGSGVAEVLVKNSEMIKAKTGQDLFLKYILDIRDYPEHPLKDKFVKDFTIIENDPEVDIVVETIGGVTFALNYQRRSINAGKSVVTSNKELVAGFGFELLTAAEEQNVSYLFEASVGGGIPLIRPIRQCLAANDITEIRGILNGTTNFILTKMINDGLSFEGALAEAKAKGYAEQNPSADIEGKDACRKICILAALANGRHVYPDQVPTEGITGVTLEDVALADSVKMKIKLLGRYLKLPDGRVTAYVAPHLVKGSDQLSHVEDVFNAVTVCGDAVGEVMFYGPGAGKLPTASAVVGDVIDASRHKQRRKDFGWTDGSKDYVADANELPFRWYVRAESPEASVPFGEVERIGERTFITPPMNRYELDKKLKNALSVFRVLD